MVVSKFKAPIPGISLTGAPKSFPWEKPPELDTVEQAINFYMSHLSKPDVVDDLMVMLEIGFPVTALVQTIRTSSVMKGKHSIDVGLLVEPVITKFITATADSLDVPYVMGGVDPEKAEREKENNRISLLLRSALADSKKTAEEDEGVALMEEIATNLENAPSEQQPQMSDVEVEADQEVVPEAADVEQTATPQGAGLMARG